MFSANAYFLVWIPEVVELKKYAVHQVLFSLLFKIFLHKHRHTIFPTRSLEKAKIPFGKLPTICGHSDYRSLEKTKIPFGKLPTICGHSDCKVFSWFATICYNLLAIATFRALSASLKFFLPVCKVLC